MVRVEGRMSGLPAEGRSFELGAWAGPKAVQGLGFRV